eukprot:gnl/TRDRNA2_/TRDRNA2_169807_c0_seq1.p1 gnl/TRDRNA2_/TRDRNA2_169807_c0~~gnl/TRDRNA2_/TRDRNA2_169807_c0_seq1.p1  ORF type:complete len:640 (-),score=86.81 gnl/TRDRNA2_/TRDRNA2_169807_c0_seq1:103-2022(-)
MFANFLGGIGVGEPQHEASFEGAESIRSLDSILEDTRSALPRMEQTSGIGTPAQASRTKLVRQESTDTDDPISRAQSVDGVKALLEPLLQRGLASSPRSTAIHTPGSSSVQGHRSPLPRSTYGNGDWTSEVAQIRLALKEEQASRSSTFSLLDTRLQGALHQLKVCMSELERFRQDREDNRSTMQKLQNSVQTRCEEIAALQKTMALRIDALESRTPAPTGSSSEIVQLRQKCVQEMEERGTNQMQLQNALNQLGSQLDGITVLQKAMAARVDDVEARVFVVQSQSQQSPAGASDIPDLFPRKQMEALASSAVQGFCKEWQEMLMELRRNMDAKHQSVQKKIDHLESERVQIRNDVDRCTEMLALAAEGLPNIETLVGRHDKQIEELGLSVAACQKEVKDAGSRATPGFSTEVEAQLRNLQDRCSGVEGNVANVFSLLRAKHSSPGDSRETSARTVMEGTPRPIDNIEVLQRMLSPRGRSKPLADLMEANRRVTSAAESMDAVGSSAFTFPDAGASLSREDTDSTQAPAPRSPPIPARASPLVNIPGPQTMPSRYEASAASSAQRSPSPKKPLQASQSSPGGVTWAASSHRSSLPTSPSAYPSSIATTSQAAAPYGRSLPGTTPRTLLQPVRQGSRLKP